MKVRSPFDLEYLGQTIDDAAGEAFDKTAKILGLPYPGGPLIDKYAKLGDPKRFKFPIPHSEGLNFSFSGLKTAILYFIRDEKIKDIDFVEKNLNDICASVQKTIVEILMKKINLAIEQTGIKEIAIAGGVSANSGLRNAIMDLKNKGCNVYIPAFEYCTDNAGMIAITGYYKYMEGKFAELSINSTARAEW